MTNTNAIIIGFSLVAASILIAGHIDDAQATFVGARYTITNGDSGLAWVLDTDSGNVVLCKPNSFSGKLEFACVREG